MSKQVIGSKFHGEYGRSDLDGLYYRKEDLLWIISPNTADPGLLVARFGAQSVDLSKPKVQKKKTIRVASPNKATKKKKAR